MQTEPVKNGANWRIAAHNLLLAQLCCQARIRHIAECMSTDSCDSASISPVIQLPVEKYKCKVKRVRNRSSEFDLPQNREMLCGPRMAQVVHRRGCVQCIAANSMIGQPHLPEMQHRRNCDLRR